MKSEKEREAIIADCLELLRREDETLESILARYPDQAGEIQPLLETANWLAQKRQTLAARPGFVGSSKYRLIWRLQAGDAKDRPGLWQRKLRVVVQPALRVAVILLLVLSVFFNGYQAVLATRTSLPGDLVYPLKQAQEALGLAFTLDAAGAARLHTRYAQLRLLEAQALVLEGRYDQIPGSVAGFEKHVVKALQLIKQVAAKDHASAVILAGDLQVALTSQSGLVTVLSHMAPPDTRMQFERVRQVSEKGVIDLESLLAPNSRWVAPQALTNPGRWPVAPSQAGHPPYSFVRRRVGL